LILANQSASFVFHSIPFSGKEETPENENCRQLLALAHPPMACVHLITDASSSAESNAENYFDGSTESAKMLTIHAPALDHLEFGMQTPYNLSVVKEFRALQSVLHGGTGSPDGAE
jgi:hypothetical protein